jgi:hypothetical protein
MDKQGFERAYVWVADEAGGIPENTTLQMAYESQGSLVVPATNIQATGTRNHGPRRKHFQHADVVLTCSNMLATNNCMW